MKCVKCGKEIPTDAKFCRYCGAKAEAVLSPKKRFCTACGTELVENAGFCKKCGAKVRTATCATASAAEVTIPVKEPVTSVTVSDEPPAEKAVRRCQKCGNELTENTKFCKKCGTAVALDAAKKAVKTLLESIQTDAPATAGETGFSASPANRALLNAAVRSMRGGK